MSSVYLALRIADLNEAEVRDFLVGAIELLAPHAKGCPDCRKLLRRLEKATAKEDALQTTLARAE